MSKRKDAMLDKSKSIRFVADVRPDELPSLPQKPRLGIFIAARRMAEVEERDTIIRAGAEVFCRVRREDKTSSLQILFAPSCVPDGITEELTAVLVRYADRKARMR